MKALLDINVILDVILVRAPGYEEAAQIWDAAYTHDFIAGIAAFTVPTVFYIVHRDTDLVHAHSTVAACLNTLEILPVARSTLEAAQLLPGEDFEDNLQMACAVESRMDCIVTRDPGGFRGVSLPVYTPAEFLAILAQSKA